ncbi:hypothetical protein QE418_000629 [Microbacterium testaceum]|uniref:hypothetical protein n=1 Tax=Microbacterium TaxID=33882 RepID=UPI0027863D44|nr:MULTISPECIES: hypothetical protein [Microbacterium]MDQ1111181.1 hypothetical protein [Microbacterium testaceum]MDR6098279.1 hypothetical protein [Microbacterium sp. SORGH_AS_0454]
MAAATSPPWLADAIALVGLGDVAAAVATVVGVVVGVWLFVKRVWPIVKTIPGGILAFARGVVTAAQVLDSVKGLPAFIERTDAAMAAVHHELHPNSGTSLNDSVRRTEARVAELGQTADRLEEGVAGLYVKYEELAAVDDRLWQTLEPDEDEEGGDDA